MFDAMPRLPRGWEWETPGDLEPALICPHDVLLEQDGAHQNAVDGECVSPLVQYGWF
ncbi:hypothetical protein ABZ470_39715 [Streptosporangium sp. NPDC020072]|uniref:hypothetical protein n=1 Tax=Streptosporangium sp. NPDC020072 TaxID=3154788 RepID=UPI00341CEA63